MHEEKCMKKKYVKKYTCIKVQEEKYMYEYSHDEGPGNAINFRGFCA
jgi:hypothetical protein